MYNFSEFKKKLIEVEGWLAREYLGIRTGKATPQILDGVNIDAYGVKTPLKQVAAVSLEDGKTIRVTPWDRGQLATIQMGIEAANLGLSVAPDSVGLRVIFPALTEERRKMFIKLAGEKLEDARISVRQEREKVWTEIQTEEKAGRLSEDEKFKAKDELQKIVDEANKKLNALADKKEKEIMN
ncbi:MAG: ribosome recycling factor [Candidatus Vogelbacteria bacterium CG10_big_fil_rev_8_21_14_0_10_49_38]|uniref:Ribosome recycling factor n=1 Tax=Candidatus Vogelbacteria bacterium CG10_big_fil_rev_8_21_14_0_10_49_38 TaxID=1975043 RepID=A0A2H0RHE8_9BACT|nr:MAG: ribosome recycling factor [bacterium CG10_49_38]PIR45981.1 MAG: ribosome recycling factor [Candidatus Vogelbacteria bacterium CG10_big_fil_rev_8_21_14_0_10_49_38]